MDDLVLSRPRAGRGTVRRGTGELQPRGTAHQSAATSSRPRPLWPRAKERQKSRRQALWWATVARRSGSSPMGGVPSPFSRTAWPHATLPAPPTSRAADRCGWSLVEGGGDLRAICSTRGMGRTPRGQVVLPLQLTGALHTVNTETQVQMPSLPLASIVRCDNGGHAALRWQISMSAPRPPDETGRRCTGPRREGRGRQAGIRRQG